jgi:hypothetical protein
MVGQGSNRLLVAPELALHSPVRGVPQKDIACFGTYTYTYDSAGNMTEKSIAVGLGSGGRAGLPVLRRYAARVSLHGSYIRCPHISLVDG